MTAHGLDADPALDQPDPRPALADRRRPTWPEVSVILPTFNEAENLPVLLDRLELTLAHLDYEIVVVDDNSPDLTWQLAEARAAQSTRLRVVRRIGRRGLSSAVLEGMAVAGGQVLAVMDTDLQHDESILPAMVAAVAEGRADVCVGSRAVDGGSYGTFGPTRRLVSGAGKLLARELLGVEVSDPMSGYFALSRDRYDLIRGSLSGRGFKILLEVLVQEGPRPTVVEVGYQFRERVAGTTKLSAGVLGSYLAAVTDLAMARLASARFATYLALALVGVVLRSSLSSLSELAGPAGVTGAVAIEVAIAVEFALHNRRTFVRRAHQGSSLLGPLVRFHLVAGYGLLAQAGLVDAVEHGLQPHGTMPATTADAVVALTLSGAGLLCVIVVSYLLSALVVWPDHHQTAYPAHTGRAGQTRRPMTRSTSPAISATARR